ncbi:MAG: hypothetical protein AB4042_08990 [Leptolyngbyaceae cyanobacterium]
MKRLIVGMAIATSIIFFPLKAYADMAQICTREPGSRVNLREGPGAEYPKGLMQVGSGGIGIIRHFEAEDYTVPDGEFISVFSSEYGEDNSLWHQVGTNQWVA